MKFIERLIAYVQHKYARGDYRYVVPILVFPTTGLYLVHNFHDLNGPIFRINGLIAICALTACAVSLAIPAYSLFRNRRTVFGKNYLPGPDSWRRAERLHVIAYQQERIMKQIQQDLTHEIFGDSTPDDRVVSELFKKNNRKSVGLYSDDEQAFVGFATIWPLTDEAAADILSGARDETKIVADDLLPPNMNKNARYCLIAAIGVKDAGTKLGKQRAVVLIKGFRRFFLNEFVGRRSTAKTIIAIAEPDGEKWCEYLGMKRVAIVVSVSGQRPLYVAEFKPKEIEDLLERLF